MKKSKQQQKIDKKQKKIEKQVEKLFKMIYNKDISISMMHIGFKDFEVVGYAGELSKTTYRAFVEATVTESNKEISR